MQWGQAVPVPCPHPLLVVHEDVADLPVVALGRQVERSVALLVWLVRPHVLHRQQVLHSDQVAPVDGVVEHREPVLVLNSVTWYNTQIPPLHSSQSYAPSGRRWPPKFCRFFPQFLSFHLKLFHTWCLIGCDITYNVLPCSIVQWCHFVLALFINSENLLF